MDKIITTLVSGSDIYIKMLKVFSLSLKTVGCCDKVFAYVINGPKELKDEISIINPAIEIVDIPLDNPTPIKILYTRPRKIMELLEAGHSKIASIDVDIIFRKNIHELWRDVDSNTIKIWDKGKVLPLDSIKRNKKEIEHYLKKKSLKIDTRLQGGVFVLGNGNDTKSYWSGILGKIPDIPDGYLIQRLMFQKLSEYNIKHLPLPPSFNDSHFNYGSEIWHGKSGHREDLKLIAAFNSYIDQINNMIKKG